MPLTIVVGCGESARLGVVAVASVAENESVEVRYVEGKREGRM